MVSKVITVVTAPTSYLQTLAHDEAIAFVASLQKVKAHLSQSLQWVNEQVQQKTAQLQGIETLLSEASALGLVAADSHAIPATTAIATPVTSAVPATATHEFTVELPATENETTLLSVSIEPTEPTSLTEPMTAIASLPVRKAATPSRSQQGKASHAKASRPAKPSASTKTSTVKAKPATSPASKATPRGKASTSQPFLKSQWRDKALTEAVSDILKRAAAPLSTDEVMAALYDGLPKDDYDRVKHSLANTLSVGKSKGAWQSVGRGLYAGNVVPTA